MEFKHLASRCRCFRRWRWSCWFTSGPGTGTKSEVLEEQVQLSTSVFGAGPQPFYGPTSGLMQVVVEVDSGNSISWWYRQEQVVEVEVEGTATQVSS
jgi:hypothetical protein